MDTYRKVGSDMAIPMDENKFNKIKSSFTINGGVIDSSPDIDNHLNRLDADAGTLNANTIIIRHNAVPTASAMFEELIHTAQYRSGKATGDNWIDMEIEAKRKLIKYQKQYEIPDSENETTKKQLAELIKLKG